MYKRNLLFNGFQLLCLASALLSFACTEPTEGCLDITASNFDIEADDDCCLSEEECCCSYPNLVVDLIYRLSEADTSNTNFELSQYYEIENTTDSIRIDTFQFFITGLRPRSVSGMDSITVRETIDVSTQNIAGESVQFSVEDNIILVDCNQFSYTIGTYQSDLEIDQLDFTLGLPSVIAQINPDDISNDNNLKNSYAPLFDEDLGRFPSIKLNFALKSNDKERIIARELNFQQLLTNIFVTAVPINKGQELSFLLQLNVLDVFKGIIFDIQNEDIDLIINENFENSISIIE